MSANNQNNDTNPHSKSKKRITDYGEVFTAQKEVKAMLDLVKHETERIDSRFLEPACGTGNFLVEILKRKLAVVEQRYSKNQLEYERNAILAVSSIYGIDILKDNVQTCRDRLLGIFTHYYILNFKNNINSECLKSVEFILSKNILWGDALTLKTPVEKEEPVMYSNNNKGEPIIFSEWSAVNGSMIKRRDYTFANLLQSQPFDGLNLFSDLGDKAFIPSPVRDFPLTHFLKLGENDANEL